MCDNTQTRERHEINPRSSAKPDKLRSSNQERNGTVDFFHSAVTTSEMLKTGSMSGRQQDASLFCMNNEQRGIWQNAAISDSTISGPNAKIYSPYAAQPPWQPD
mgnify:FL=1